MSLLSARAWHRGKHTASGCKAAARHQERARGMKSGARACGGGGRGLRFCLYVGVACFCRHFINRPALAAWLRQYYRPLPANERTPLPPPRRGVAVPTDCC